LGPDVAEIPREVGQEGLYIDPVLLPAAEPLNGKGMA
jgi:hypothetical protein